MGTHVGAVARELAGRRRDLMAREERREAQYYYMAHIRVRGGQAMTSRAFSKPSRVG